MSFRRSWYSFSICNSSKRIFSSSMFCVCNTPTDRNTGLNKLDARPYVLLTYCYVITVFFHVTNPALSNGYCKHTHRPSPPGLTWWRGSLQCGWSACCSSVLCLPYQWSSTSAGSHLQTLSAGADGQTWSPSEDKVSQWTHILAV